ncbi:MAG: hypothetical protein ABI766_12860 [Gemmatimonadales bacterium]
MLQELKQREAIDRARLWTQEPGSPESADGLMCRALADTEIVLKRLVRGLRSFGKSKRHSDIDRAKYKLIQHGASDVRYLGIPNKLLHLSRSRKSSLMPDMP